MGTGYTVDFSKLKRAASIPGASFRDLALRCEVSVGSIQKVADGHPLSARSVRSIESALGTSAIHFLTDGRISDWCKAYPETTLVDSQRFRFNLDAEVFRRKPQSQHPFALVSPNNPLISGDQIRMELRVSPAAFLYTYWIKPRGFVSPLYPLTEQAGDESSTENRMQVLGLPRASGTAWTYTAEQGVDSVLFIAHTRCLTKAMHRDIHGLSKQSNLSRLETSGANIVTPLEIRYRRDLPASMTRLPLSSTPIEADDPILSRHRLFLNFLQPRVEAVGIISFTAMNSDERSQ